jgi:hypothetical protein
MFFGPPGAQGPSCRILRGHCVFAGAGYGAGPCWCVAHDPHPITAEAYEAVAATLPFGSVTFERV